MSEGLEACREALEERSDKTVPTDFIIKLLEIILKYNIFEFNQEQLIQMIGTAMGAVPAVSYANITMAKVMDPKILKAADNFKTNDVFPIIFMKRFLDDIKMVWRGNAEKLHAFLDALNQLHPSLQFTMSHTTSKYPGDQCECPAATSIPFLDTSCSIVNGIIKTDLYKKETDRNQYLLTSSCHPSHVTSNIPFSLALRILRICSNPEDREKRFSELKSMLLARDYKSKLIINCIEKL